MAGEELPTVGCIHENHEFVEEQWNLACRGTREVRPHQTLQSIRDDVRGLYGAYRRAAPLLNRPG